MKLEMGVVNKSAFINSGNKPIPYKILISGWGCLTNTNQTLKSWFEKRFETPLLRKCSLNLPTSWLPPLSTSTLCTTSTSRTSTTDKDSRNLSKFSLISLFWKINRLSKFPNRPGNSTLFKMCLVTSMTKENVTKK